MSIKAPLPTLSRWSLFYWSNKRTKEQRSLGHKERRSERSRPAYRQTQARHRTQENQTIESDQMNCLSLDLPFEITEQQHFWKARKFASLWLDHTGKHRKDTKLCCSKPWVSNCHLRQPVSVFSDWIENNKVFWIRETQRFRLAQDVPRASFIYLDC